MVDNPDQDVHVIDVIFRELANYGNSKYGKKSDSLQFFASFDEDDPLKKKEAELLIEYVDHFNNLFDFGQFELAAMHAANSPMGILRSYETMIKFKQAECKEGEVSPLVRSSHQLKQITEPFHCLVLRYPVSGFPSCLS